MIKKLIIAVLIAALIASICFCAVGCEKEPLLIVYLGDSIAEGIAGVSPVSERERYAYYGVIGIRNEYEFRNRSVSGHQTKDMLEIIKREDNDVKMTRTLLTDADIIHISILGNDLLLEDLGQLIIDTVNEDFTTLNTILDKSKANFAEIVQTLRSYNPNATILIQTLYNPVFEDCDLISAATREVLTEMEVSESEYRSYGAILLDRLNNVIFDYLAEHSGAYIIVDVKAEFERIYQENPVRGAGLVFVDSIHPSNEGHAVIADLNQAKLESLKLADNKTAVDNYKALRKEQLGRLFAANANVAALSAAIDGCNTCAEITSVFFEATNGLEPAIE